MVERTESDHERGRKRRIVRGVAAAAALAGAALALSAAGSDGETGPAWLRSEHTRQAIVGDGGRTVGYISTTAMAKGPTVVDGRIQTADQAFPVYDLDGVRVGDFGSHGFVAAGKTPADTSPPTTVSG